jgi:hypothetical protein
MSDDGSVPIAIVRTGDLYEATVSPPHGRGVEWTSPQPMTAEALVEALLDCGCHRTDIGDAFYDADPEWQLR